MFSWRTVFFFFFLFSFGGINDDIVAPRLSPSRRKAQFAWYDIECPERIVRGRDEKQLETGGKWQ